MFVCLVLTNLYRRPSENDSTLDRPRSENATPYRRPDGRTQWPTTMHVGADGGWGKNGFELFAFSWSYNTFVKPLQRCACLFCWVKLETVSLMNIYTFFHRCQSKASLVQIMLYRLLGTKQLPEPVRTCLTLRNKFLWIVIYFEITSGIYQYINFMIDYTIIKFR